MRKVDRVVNHYEKVSMKKLVMIGLVGLLLWVTWLGWPSQNPGQTACGAHAPVQPCSDLPIIIDDNADFALYASLGNGSAANPYVIEHKVIDGGDQMGISINYTTAHFVVQNCTITNGRYGIYLYQVRNFQLVNNTVTNSNYTGISLKQCGDGSIRNTTIRFCTTFGIWGYKSWNITVQDSVVYNCTNNIYFGFTGSSLRLYIHIYNNTLFNAARAGIYLDNVENSTLSYNKISRNLWGIFVDFSCSNIVVNNNTLQFNPGGIIIMTSDHCYVVNNTITHSEFDPDGTGIDLISCSFSRIHNNIICNNTPYGIYLQGSSNNTITGNILHGNQRAIGISSRYPPCANNTLAPNDIRDRAPDAPMLNSVACYSSCLDCDSILLQISWWGSIGATWYYLYRANYSFVSTAGMTPIAQIADDGRYNLYYFYDTVNQSGTYHYALVAGNPWENSSVSNSANRTVEVRDCGKRSIPGFGTIIIFWGLLCLIGFQEFSSTKKKNFIYQKKNNLNLNLSGFSQFSARAYFHN